MDNILDNLADVGAFKRGEFTLSSGERSSFYLDLRLLIGYPELLSRVADLYVAQIVESFQFGERLDRIAGIPYAAIPLAVLISQKTGIPMIYNRRDWKEYGMHKLVEGPFNTGDRVFLIEDVITTGRSVMGTAKIFQDEGLVVEDVAAFLIRKQDTIESLDSIGIKIHYIYSIDTLLDFAAIEGIKQRSRGETN